MVENKLMGVAGTRLWLPTPVSLTEVAMVFGEYNTFAIHCGY